MKRNIILIWTLSAFVSNVCADVIVKKDGTSLEVYNIEVGAKYITYTKGQSPDSELARIPCEDCFAIKEGDGEMKMIGSQVTQEPVKSAVPEKQDGSSSFVKAIPAEDNLETVDQYNRAHYIYRDKDKENKNKLHTGQSLAVWGVSPQSVMSDENVTISIEPSEKYSREGGMLLGCLIDTGFKINSGFIISIKNKTNANLYLDLTNSFRIDCNEIAKPFFDNTVYTTNQTGSRGAGLNLGAVTNAIGIGGALGALAGGVNVGGGSSTSATVSKSDQPILVIPPHGKVYLPSEKVVKDNKIIELPDFYYFTNKSIPFDSFTRTYLWEDVVVKTDSKPQLYSDNIGLHENGFVSFTESDSPKKYGYLISYSTDPSFNTIIQTNINVYMRGIYGFKGFSGSTGKNKHLNEFIHNSPDPFIWGFADVLKR